MIKQAVDLAWEIMFWILAVIAAIIIALVTYSNSVQEKAAREAETTVEASESENVIENNETTENNTTTPAE